MPQAWHFYACAALCSPSDIPNGYKELLEEVAGRIARTQTRAALAISRELVLLCWSIRAEINFDFLTLTHPLEERKLERGLLTHMRPPARSVSGIDSFLKDKGVVWVVKI